MLALQDKQLILDIISNYENDPSSLIQVLNIVQDELGYLPQIALEVIADELKVPISKIYGILTFYDKFKQEKPGKYIITCCQGTACFVKGGKNVLEEMKKSLNIDVNQTTKDGMFTLSTSRCLSACSTAPAITVNKESHATVSADSVEKIIQKYKHQ